MPVTAVQGISKDDESWTLKFSAVRALLATHSRIKAQEQDGEQVEDNSHGQRQEKVWEMVHAEVLQSWIMVNKSWTDRIVLVGEKN